MIPIMNPTALGPSVAADTDERVAIVTGANTGIGRVTALVLARHGWHVFLACRSAAKTAPVVAEIAAQVGARRAARWRDCGGSWLVLKTRARSARGLVCFGSGP